MGYDYDPRTMEEHYMGWVSGLWVIPLVYDNSEQKLSGILNGVPEGEHQPIRGKGKNGSWIIIPSLFVCGRLGSDNPTPPPTPTLHSPFDLHTQNQHQTIDPLVYNS